MVTIEQVENGYILDLDHDRSICVTTEELLERLLLRFDGRAKTFTGESYGRVVIEREPKPDTDQEDCDEYAAAVRKARASVARLSDKGLLRRRKACRGRLMWGDSALETVAMFRVITELLNRAGKGDGRVPEVHP